jgi:predicted nucleic acid-binding protein
VKYVVDASVAVKWYVPENYSVEAERLLDHTHELHAPDLIVPEFGNILWKKVGRDELTAAGARKIIRAFIAVPLIKHPTLSLLEPAFEGAIQGSQTVYDWSYLSLAIALNCQMVTAHKKFYLELGSTALLPHLCWVADIP